MRYCGYTGECDVNAFLVKIYSYTVTDNVFTCKQTSHVHVFFPQVPVAYINVSCLEKFKFLYYL